VLQSKIQIPWFLAFGFTLLILGAIFILLPKSPEDLLLLKEHSQNTSWILTRLAKFSVLPSVTFAVLGFITDRCYRKIQTKGRVYSRIFVFFIGLAVMFVLWLAFGSTSILNRWIFSYGEFKTKSP
jgi:hypothetical protein